MKFVKLWSQSLCAVHYFSCILFRHVEKQFPTPNFSQPPPPYFSIGPKDKHFISINNQMGTRLSLLLNKPSQNFDVSSKGLTYSKMNGLRLRYRNIQILLIYFQPVEPLQTKACSFDWHNLHWQRQFSLLLHVHVFSSRYCYICIDIFNTYAYICMVLLKFLDQSILYKYTS